MRVPRWLKLLATLLAALGAVLLGVTVARRIAGALPAALAGVAGDLARGKKLTWARVPGDDRKVVVKHGQDWKTVPLPEGVSARDVRAAALVDGRVRVEKRRARRA